MKVRLACITFLFAHSIWAQDISPVVQTMSVDEGLSQSSVNSIYQDRQGFLWIGTGDGLNRYDGKQIKIFKAPIDINHPSNANLIRGKIAEDKNGNIWYTSENGLYTLNRNTYTIERKHTFIRKELAGSDYLLVFIDAQQKVWMYSIGNGFACYSIRSGKFEAFPRPYSVDEYRLSKGNFDVENERIWFVLNQGDGIYCFDTRTKKITHNLGLKDLRFIRFKKDGYYLVGANSIQQFDSATRKINEVTKLPVYPSEVRDLVEDRFGRLWIATTNHRLWYYDVKKKKAEEIYPEDFIQPLHTITTLFIDQTQNLWVGTDDAGINRLDLKPPSFHLLTARDFKVPSLFIRSVAEDAQGLIWILSLNNPLLVYDPKNREMVHNEIISKINADKPTSLNSDDDGNIWFDCEHVTYIVDTSGKLHQHSNLLRTSEKAKKIYKIRRLRSGEIALSTSSGFIFLKEDWATHQYPAPQHISFVPVDFVETDDNSLWVATKNDGLVKVVRNDTGDLIEQKNFFPNLYIYCIHQDRQNTGLFWLASDKGLIQFNRSTYCYQLYSEKEGMNNGNVYNILEDSRGNLWSGTMGGIVKFNKATKQVSNFTVKDGLQNNEFNSRAFFKGRSGNFYFGGVKGINWFNPESVASDTTTAQVAVSELLINDTKVSDSTLTTEIISLPYFKNDLFLRFSIFDFSKPESNKIRCQLIGWDEKPIISYSATVTYNNVLPGTYTLVYSASTSNNYWSKDKTLTLIIEPPFWQRWWFYTVVISCITMVVVSIVWFFVRQRYKMKIAELEKQNAIERERRRISMEIHDDIGANLTRISLISEAAKHSSEKEKALDQIALTSRQVVSSMGEIIWSLNPDNKTFDQLMSYLRDQLHNLLEPTGIDYQIDLPEAGTYLLSNTVKRNLILLVKEAVNNAVKHAGATEIKVEGRMIENVFEIQVIDNGCGFESTNGFNGNGMRNAKIRVNEIHGSLKITSLPERGTKITFQIPIGLEEHYH